MAKKVSPDGMGKAIADILNEYEGATFDNMKKAVDKVAEESVKELKSKSPRRTGKYAGEWAAKGVAQSKSNAYGKIVYNKKRYRLTHLLEKGHKKVNGGFVAARPHIREVEEKAIKDLVKMIKEGV